MKDSNDNLFFTTGCVKAIIYGTLNLLLILLLPESISYVSILSVTESYRIKGMRCVFSERLGGTGYLEF